LSINETVADTDRLTPWNRQREETASNGRSCL